MANPGIENRARELAAELPLSAEDWKAIVVQVESMQPLVKSLDELPLEGVEPAEIYRVIDEPTEGECRD